MQANYIGQTILIKEYSNPVELLEEGCSVMKLHAGKALLIQAHV